MNDAGKSRGRGALSLLLRSYLADVRGWAGRLAAGYAVAAVVMVGGVLALFAAIAVGIGALFRFIAHQYGIEIAFAAIGGGLFVIAMILLLIGWAMMRRRLAPLPRPHRQIQTARRVLVRPVVAGAVRRLNTVKAIGGDPVTRVLTGAAVALLLGWIAGSRARSIGRQ